MSDFARQVIADALKSAAASTNPDFLACRKYHVEGIFDCGSQSCGKQCCAIAAVALDPELLKPALANVVPGEWYSATEHQIGGVTYHALVLSVNRCKGLAPPGE